MTTHDTRPEKTLEGRNIADLPSKAVVLGDESPQTQLVGSDSLSAGQLGQHLPKFVHPEFAVYVPVPKHQVEWNDLIGKSDAHGNILTVEEAEANAKAVLSTFPAPGRKYPLPVGAKAIRYDRKQDRYVDADLEAEAAESRSPRRAAPAASVSEASLTTDNNASDPTIQDSPGRSPVSDGSERGLCEPTIAPASRDDGLTSEGASPTVDGAEENIGALRTHSYETNANKESPKETKSSDRLLKEKPNTDATVGARIRSIRERANVQSQALAKTLSIDPSAMSNIESGKRSVKSSELAIIADALGVSPLALLSDDTLLSKFPPVPNNALRTHFAGDGCEPPHDSFDVMFPERKPVELTGKKRKRSNAERKNRKAKTS